MQEELFWDSAATGAGAAPALSDPAATSANRQPHGRKPGPLRRQTGPVNAASTGVQGPLSASAGDPSSTPTVSVQWDNPDSPPRAESEEDTNSSSPV